MINIINICCLALSIWFTTLNVGLMLAKQEVPWNNYAIQSFSTAIFLFNHFNMWRYVVMSNNNQDKIVDEDILYSVVEKAKKYDRLIKPFKNKRLQCSFCGKSEDQVIKLIAGPSVYICDECIELCHEVLLEEVNTAK